MKHREGPTKRLAPAISPEVRCPHTFVEEEGLQLEINCEECAGAHDLTNTRCTVGVLNVISGGAVPETIILKRFTHKRYRKDSVKLISIAANELSALNRALSAPDSVSDERCRTCLASRRQVVTSLKRMLLSDPRDYVTRDGAVGDAIERGHADVACGRASACVEAGLSASTLRGGGRR